MPTFASSSPALSGRAVYVGSGPGRSLTSYDAATGAPLWTAPLPAPVTKTPALANGIVFASAEGRLYGFDAAGHTRCSGSPVACQPLWAVTPGTGTASAPAVANGAVHVASGDGSVSVFGLPRIGFGKSVLQGTSSTSPTAVQFGPDGRLYVAQFDGLIKAYTVTRSAPNRYAVTATETIPLVRQIPNHDDDGKANPTVDTRLLTGLLVVGSASAPVIYTSSSDPRIGGGAKGTVTPLDTNSGVISRLTRSGGVWHRLDLVRGLPRSEENHATNALALDAATNTLFVGQGGNTNLGAPSNNFSLLPEYAYSAAVLRIDLAAIGNATYDLPTLTDERLPTLTGPFGGDFGRRQARITASSPVQVHAPGFRNPFGLVRTRAGRLYVVDNGSNAGWGDVPAGAGAGGRCTNARREPGVSQPDSLHLVTGPGYYAGHPNPTRGNRANTFNSTNPQSPVPVANPVECDPARPAPTDPSRRSTPRRPEPPSTRRGTSPTRWTATSSWPTSTGACGACGRRRRARRWSRAPRCSRTSAPTPSGSRPRATPARSAGRSGCPTSPTAPSRCSSRPTSAANLRRRAPGRTSTSLDEDGDHFTNADEIGNGTDPCSAADQPHDWNGNFVSDRNDPDDDSDGRPDTSDPFALDPADGTTTRVPIGYSWKNGTTGNPCAPTPSPSGCPGGLVGAGFTGLMTDGVTDYAALFDESKMTVGGAAGVFTVDAVPPGDATGAANSQRFGFQYGVDARPDEVGIFTIHARIVAPFAGSIPQGRQSMGLFIGAGDQDDFLELAVTANGGSPGVELYREIAGAGTPTAFAPEALPGPDAVDLYLTVDPASATARGSYRVTTSGVAGALVQLGSAVSIPSGWVTDPARGLALGILATSSGGPVFPATWDLLEATLGAPT